MEKKFIGKKYLTSSKYITFIEAMKAGKSLNDICIMLGLDSEYAKEQYIKAMPRVKLELCRATSRKKLDFPVGS